MSLRPRSGSAILCLLGGMVSAACDDGMGVANVLVVSTVDISPPDAEIVLGGNVHLVATPKTGSGIPVPGRGVSWSSSSTSTVSVSTDGIAQAVALGGPVTITATVDGVAGAATITVNPVPIATITLSAQSRDLSVGESFQLTATAHDDNGAVLPGRVFTWQSSQPSIAAVTSTGVVLGMSMGGPVTITATAEGQSGAAAITVVARPATKLGFLQQPGGTAAGQPITPAIRVAIQDDQGGTVTTGSHTITLSLAANPGGSTLSGTVSALAVAGVATFNNVSLNLAGNGYTLAAASAGLTSATSSAFNITAGNANQLVLTTAPPSSAGSGVPLSPQPVLQVRDAGGNPVSQAGIVVTGSIASGSASLSGATATTNGSGTATFSALTLTGTAGTVSLAFSASSLTPVTSPPIALGAGAAALLEISQQPSATAQSGVAFGQQPKVILRDAAGNRVAQAGVAVTASIASAPGGSLGGTTVAATDATGEAGFGNLSLTGPAGSYTLRFTSGSLAAANSNAIALSAGTGQSLAITVQPSSSSASGAVFAQQPSVQLRDGAGNPVAQANVQVTATIQSGGGTLSGTGTAATNGSGIATFTNLGIAGTIGARTLLFAAAGYVSVASNPINITPGPATQLGITTQPSATAISGQALAQQPVVQLRDAQGNAVPSAGVTVTAAIASGGGSLGGTLAIATNASGVAGFSNLAISGTAGNRTLSFTAPGLTTATSSAILVSAPPTKLGIVTQPPTTAQSGAGFSTAPVVQLQDGSGAAVANAGVAVTVALNGASGTLGGTLTFNTDATGKATFTGLSISGPVGNYTLAFSSAGLTGVTSTAIGLTAGPATQLSITTQPSATAVSGQPLAQQPVVQLRDAAGNAVASAGVTVTAAIASGGGTLGGTAAIATNASGVATFTNLSITGTAGNRTLSFSGTGLTAATSGAILVAAPTKLGIVTQPPATAQSGAAFSTAPVVQLQDAAGAAVASAGVAVTVALSGASGTLGGTLTVNTDASGKATFTGLSISGAVGNYTLAFSSTGLTGATSNAIALSAGAAAKLEIVTQPPATAKSGVNLAPQPVIRVTDAAGNPVATSGLTVTAALVSGLATLGGDRTKDTNGSGVATFTDLRITGTGNYSIRFTASGVTEIISISIAVTL